MVPALPGAKVLRAFRENLPWEANEQGQGYERREQDHAEQGDSAVPADSGWVQERVAPEVHDRCETEEAQSAFRSLSRRA